MNAEISQENVKSFCVKTQQNHNTKPKHFPVEISRPPSLSHLQPIQVTDLKNILEVSD